MEIRALCIILLMTIMTLMGVQGQKVDAVSLHIYPNRLQFFEYDAVTFHCEGVDYCEVMHKFKGKIKSCNKMNERTPTGSSCMIKTTYTDDSGEYWYETEGGTRSNSINISVTDGSVILESPAVPVLMEETVTLSCRNKIASFNFKADFYKDGRHIIGSSTGNMTIQRVSKSDEGLYKCRISGVGESPESWLKVTDAVFLHIVPNRLQFFKYETVTFHCEGVVYCEVVHKFKGKIKPCNITNERTPTGSSCKIKTVYTDNSGEYWYETGGGTRSNSINMSVTDGSVILESPAVPVLMQETVTLSCRNKIASFNLAADFYKNGRLIHRTSTGSMTIQEVSKFPSQMKDFTSVTSQEMDYHQRAG
ncbi:sialoadhesin-like [Simochromis diagramma]|uniref:sialoadhesin-like n=1 Tax=Simochromis diagramma TaxID=43689 RepID=UPI001A7E2DFD|nr:sialoadhesin-like [Simochromis diagramma]